MKKSPEPVPTWGGVPLRRRQILLGIAAVGGFLAVDLGAVSYAAGWIDPARRLTPDMFIKAFERVNGRQPGFRKNHAKGVAVAGYFDSNGNGREVSSAAVFQPGRTPVHGRFSLAGGNAHAADMAATARGLGLAIGFPGGAQWRTAMLNLPVFPDRSPQGFYDRLLASKPAADTGKPDPQAMASFLRAHPETAMAMTLIGQSPPTAGFADDTFRSLNTFYMVDDTGLRTPVRWSLVPLVSVQTRQSSGPNRLFDAVTRQIRSGPLQWRLVLAVGEPSDQLNDATVPWPAHRRTIDCGTLTLTSIETERRGNARDINFDPLVLPPGIEPSDDPLLSPRSAVYAASYRLRTREPKARSAVDVEAVAP
ncbi:MAG: catalase family peroxidase [Mycobacterium sp.]